MYLLVTRIDDKILVFHESHVQCQNLAFILCSGDGNTDDKRRKVKHTTRRSGESQSVHTPLMRGKDAIHMQEL